MKLLRVLNLPAGLYPPTDELLNDYYDLAAPVRKNLLEVLVPVYQTMIDDNTTLTMIDLDLVVMPIPPDGNKTADPVGFVLFPLLTGQINAVDIQLASGITFNLSGGFESKVIRAEIRPEGTAVKVSTGDTSLSALAKLTGQPTSHWILLGSEKSSRLELGKAHISLGANGPVDNITYKIEVGADSLTLVLDFGEGDGFLQKLLGGKPQSLDLSTVVSWSNKTGFGFSGQATLEANIPVHLSIADILSIETIYIALRASSDSKALLQIALTGGLGIGPVATTVDRVGMQLELTPRSKTDPPGNLGKLNLGFGFKPPNGLGLLIDAGAVVGGGYVFFDVDKGEYAGVLELKLETVQIKVIGLLDTKLPGGVPGFSFLFIVSVEFTPIQLGFGFSLNGVGGLAGINRTMMLDVLRTGLRNHTLNSILFPDDPVRHAQQLISDLRAVFPPVDGRYVFCPMLEIAWGGFILVAKLGFVLELPSPVRLAILGQITAALPTQDEGIILIHMDVLGAIDFEKKLLSIDATLYDSRVVIFALQGDMALRLTWGDNPNFALSLGGFFPGFQPPQGFPTLHRLMISVTYASIIQLSLSTYMAFTSNSVQFGANLELKIDLDAVRIHGYFGFDALFIFSPFSFIVHMQAGVDLEVDGLSLFSIHLDATLSGPTPWHIQVTASIDFLFFSIDVHVDKTFGEDKQITLPQVNVKPPLLDALNNPQNWSGSLPASAETGVSLAKVEVDDKTILMQPMGLLTVRQTLVPLGVQIAKFNNAAPADADQFDITGVTIDGRTEAEVDVPDYFASGQFFALSNADKVTAPSYTRMKAGLKIGSEDLHYGHQSNLELHYDTRIVDDLQIPGRPAGFYSMPLTTMLAVNQIGAAELSLVRSTGNAKYVVPGTVSAVSTSDPSYVIASTVDLSVHPDLSTVEGMPYFVATTTLQSHLAAHPEDEGLFRVLPLHEAVTA
jgi:hypothetical protein